ncbi:C-type lectin domain family 11 member A [Elysia marginata]|uniref:C-type lectin domain family 11 member A n=1 Tax=Elysia marginata TaxID=1093978 RepID=A0AAV4ELN4_9GAST|nr:C-type lectin domain family 11 member A [Elysia marginata]
MFAFDANLHTLIATALQALTGTGITTVENGCPTNVVKSVGSQFFSVLGDACFQFVTNDDVPFETAQKTCRQHNGTLAMPKTKYINDFLLQEMQRRQQLKPMWIGMQDTIREGIYVWEDGSQVRHWGNMHYFNGEPFSSGEDCLALNPLDWQWHDFDCSNEKHSFICQYDVQS